MKNFLRAILLLAALLLAAAQALQAEGKRQIVVKAPTLSLNDVENVSLEERLARGEKGDNFSLFMAGLRLCFQEKDLAAAQKIFKELDAKNYEPARGMLAAVSEEIKYKKILEKGLEEVGQLAENGDADAMYALYFARKNGLAKNLDARSAARHCVRAAEAGLAIAQREAGRVYYYGNLGRAKNPKLAAQWFRKAQKGGEARANGYMGECYLLGEGVVKNKKKALEFFFEGEKNSDSLSLFYLGYLAANGGLEGFTKEQGLEFFKRGAMMGNRECLFYLAKHYFDAADDKEALFWGRLAFVFGYKDAMAIIKPAYANISAANFAAEQNEIARKKSAAKSK